MNRANAAEVEGVRIAPLADVVINKVRIMNDFSFDPRTARRLQGGLDRDTLDRRGTSMLVRESSDQILGQITSLRVQYPDKRILMSKADVSTLLETSASPQTKRKTYVMFW